MNTLTVHGLSESRTFPQMTADTFGPATLGSAPGPITISCVALAESLISGCRFPHL